jgi:hypothetical protein
VTLTEPYRFDMAYARCFAVPQMAMDRRHIFMLHGVLCGHPFQNALEIGSFNGASATAFVEAINKGEGLGESGSATFCDVVLTHSLMAVAGNCRFPGRVRLTKQPSWDLLDSPEDFDFVFVDANHDLGSVREELRRLVARKPLCVMAHDTNAADAGFPKCEGARLLKQTFKLMPEYHCIEDRERREGELTHRGLFLATRDAGLYAVAKQVFADLS